VVARDGGTRRRTTEPLRVTLLGGFRVDRAGTGRPVSGWQRRTAKTLTKLLATVPGHALHREQILEILWPDVDLESALNSFAKALYAARRAFEPRLLPRETSTYLRLTDAVLALDTEHVVIDADAFQDLAQSALRQRSISAYEAALAAYAGELLPEDRYEDWSAERRTTLAGLHVRLLLRLAETLESRGDYSQAADRLHAALQQDATREDIHRRLMRLYAETGSRDQAVRQFQLCRDALQRGLDLLPEAETVTLYRDVLANRIARRPPVAERHGAFGECHRPPAADHALAGPLVGREATLERVRGQLTRADQGRGSMLVLSGEAGVGKTRLAAELAADAGRRGACVLWGGSAAHADHLAYGSLAVALEGYAASRPEAERHELARRYPALVHFVPSLGITDDLPPLADRPGDEHLYLLPTIVRLLTDLARDRPLVLVLGDLHGHHAPTLELLQYLGHLAAQRRWLLIGTVQEDVWEAGGGVRRMIEATMRERVCVHVELQRLRREGCDQLVRAMLPGARVDDTFLEHVYAQTLGNPLFVEELVRELQQRDELALSNGSWREVASRPGRVPRRVRALVDMTVAPMEQSVRQVLELAAAAGDIDPSLTELRTGAAALRPPVDDDALLAALDRALEVRILEERDDAYAFRHPLFRAALYEHLSSHRRDQVNAALGRSAAQAPPHHLRAAG
jgi:DNA-binding SARP family transcriptional activator